jgi:hypothetical protein
MKNSDYRLAGSTALEDRGFEVRIAPGRGYLPGSRLVARRERRKIDVAVKASQQRAISFTRRPDSGWRTLSGVDVIVVVVPDQHNSEEADVFGFERKALVRAFNRAWKALEKAKRPTGFNLPVFIPIDEASRKNVGHNVGNLKKSAAWSVHFTKEELEKRTSGNELSYVDAFRRRFAADNGVDVSQVVVSIVGQPQ